MWLEWIDVLVAIATGLVLRFGIPVVFTGLLIWWLRRLDIRWQAEAEETGRLRLAQISRTPCWEIRHCSEESRASCPAYQHQDTPCWQVMRQITGRLPERCFDCPVFRNAPASALAPVPHPA
jgi:hypothetical protein